MSNMAVMQIFLFAVYDGAAKRFLETFPADTPEVAIRMFKSIVNKPGHQFNSFPEDYALFQVGAFDQENGMLLPNAQPVNLGLAIQYIARVEDLRDAEPIQLTKEVADA